MKKTWTAVLLVCAVAISLLAGCSGTKPVNNSASAVSSESSYASSSMTDSIASSTVSGIASSVASTSKAVSKAVSTTQTATTGMAAGVKSSLASGGYNTAQQATLSTATSGATIYYTTNGKDPTTASAKYTGPIPVSATMVLKAIAVKSGMKNSAVAIFTYEFNKLSGSITADGSTALQPLLNLAAPMFRSKYSAVFSGSVMINGGGSGTGLTDVEAGTVDIGNSDVTVAQAGKNFTDLVDHPVCVVAVAMVVSSDVSSHFGSNAISMDSIKKIYAGTITNWKDIPGSGGYDKPILVCYRKAGSGTRTLFETFGTGVKFDESAAYVKDNDAFKFTNASSDLQSAVDNAQGAIGYETLPYANGMRKLPVDFGGGAVPCDYAHVNNGTYKIWGFEHLYTKGKPNATVQAFIDFVTSADFQSTILSNGYGLSSNVPDWVAASHR